MEITKEILVSSSNTNFTTGTEGQGGGSEIGDEISPVPDEKMEVWKKELQQRLFLLHQRKKESSSVMPRKNRTANLYPSREKNADEDRSELIEKAYTASASAETTQQDFDLLTQSLHKRQKIGAQKEPSTVVKFIPGLPKTIEAVVELWRRGDENLDCQPLRKFTDSEMRKKLVPNYSHQMWTFSGQKSCFLRIKALVERVQEFGPVRMRLLEIGSDDDWEQALQGFHAVYDKDGRPQALSRVLRQKD